MVYRGLLLLLLVLCLFSVGLHAQTFAEWFNQKKTQTKYLIAQIAELKVYAGLLNKGYSIAKGGLNTINNIKHGQFDLHADWFASLKDVKPAIRDMALVADIIAYQRQIITLCKATRPVLTTDVLGNYSGTAQLGFDGITTQVSASLDMLTMLLTSGKLEMKDNARIGILEQMDSDLADLYKFCQRYQVTTMQMMRQRRAEEGQLNWFKIEKGLQ